MKKNDTLDDITEDDGDGVVTDYFTDKMVVLDEADVPGASLNGKKPCQLTVAQLKRWLACRGAPVSGRKPELIERLAICVSEQHIERFSGIYVHY